MMGMEKISPSVRESSAGVSMNVIKKYEGLS